VAGCSRPAAELNGKCVEHRAGERAASGVSLLASGDVSGKGGHPYERKSAVIYLAVFESAGLLKVGKTTPWDLSARLRSATSELNRPRGELVPASARVERSEAWSVSLAQPLLWAESERIEHASARRLAYLTASVSVTYEEGNEWLRHDAIDAVDWRSAFHRSVAETLAFFGRDPGEAAAATRVV
jgi:hypothetical protein